MQSLLKALAWTLAHSLWEGFFAALLAAVIISTTGKTKARLRYNLLGMVFVLFFTTVLITFIVQFREITSSLLVTSAVGNESVNTITNNSTETITGGLITDLTAWFNDNTSLILLAWTLFFLVNCIKLITGLAAVNRLRHYKAYPVNEEWRIKLEQLRDALGIRQSIDLLQSELVKVPVVLGFLKPVILLPVGLITNIPPEQAEAILLHELGHIRRKDYLVNFLQYFAEAIFFFNPAILWISSLLRQEREACCDDIVVARTGQKRNYLDALVSFQEYTIPHTPYALGISSRKQYLLNRVKRIITNENKKLNLVEKAALLSGILLFSAFTYVAQEKEVTAEPFTLPVERSVIMEQSNTPVVKDVIAETAIKQSTTEKKKIKRTYKPITDTIPVKTEKASQDISTPVSPSLPVVKENKEISEADKVLQEIIKIKEQIGVKKGIIGAGKDQLKVVQGNSKEEKIIKDKIERERAEIEGQREILEKKRAELEKIKRQNEQEKRQREISVEWKIRRGNEWGNRNVNEWENREKNELKNQIKNENKNEIRYETKFEKQENRIIEPKMEIKKIKTAEFKNDYGAKVTIDKEPGLFKSRKASLFKTERQERRFNVDRKKKIQSLKAPPQKENPKSPAPPPMKNPPA